VHDDSVSNLPVRRGRDPVLISDLERVDHAEDLGERAAGRRGVGEREADGLFRVDDKDGADGEGYSLGVFVGRVLVVELVSGGDQF
jgi:hypothetical protein